MFVKITKEKEEEKQSSNSLSTTLTKNKKEEEENLTENDVNESNIGKIRTNHTWANDIKSSVNPLVDNSELGENTKFTINLDELEQNPDDNNIDVSFKSSPTTAEVISSLNKKMPYITSKSSENKKLKADDAYQDVNNSIKKVKFDSFLEKAKKVKNQTTPKNLSSCFKKLGAYEMNVKKEYNESLEHFRKALKLDKIIYDKFKINKLPLIESYINVGSAHGKLKDFNNALNSYQESLDTLQKLNKEVDTLGFKTEENEQEYYKNILQYYQKIQATLSSIDVKNENSKHTIENHADFIATYQYTLGSVYKKLGQDQEAIQHYESACGVYQIMKDHEQLLNCNLELASMYEKSEQYEKAGQCYKLACESYAITSNLEQVGTCNIRLGSVYEKLGEYEKAKQCYEIAYGIYNTNNNLEQLANCNLGLGSVYKKSGADKNAKTCYESAIGIYDQLTQKIESKLDINKSDLQDVITLQEMAKLGLIYKNLSSAYENLNDFNTALDYRKQAEEIFNKIKNTGNSLEQIFGLESIENLNEILQPTEEEKRKFAEEAKINNYSEENLSANIDTPFKEEEDSDENNKINLTDIKPQEPEEGINDDVFDLYSSNDDESDEKDTYENLDDNPLANCVILDDNIINKTPEEFAKLGFDTICDHLNNWTKQQAKEWPSWSDDEQKKFAADMKEFKFVDYNKWLKQFNELTKQTPTEPHDLENLTIIDGVIEKKLGNPEIELVCDLQTEENSHNLAGNNSPTEENPDS